MSSGMWMSCSVSGGTRWLVSVAAPNGQRATPLVVRGAGSARSTAGAALTSIRLRWIPSSNAARVGTYTADVARSAAPSRPFLTLTFSAD